MRYYLNLRNGDHRVRDLVGANFASLDDARIEALMAARQALDDQVFEIIDEAGDTVMSVPFLDAFRLH